MTPDELFPPEAIASLSPKLPWLRLHNLETVQLRGPDDLAESPETGDDVPQWVCRVIKPDMENCAWNEREIAGGDTEDEAICAFCEASGTTHWSATP
jgi:hypothetical protein